jgi:two-component system response regulator RegA
MPESIMLPLSDTPRLLIVEDDEVLRSRLARAFADRGFAVREAPSGERALAAVRAAPADYAVVDLRMPGLPGLEVVRQLKAGDPAMTIVVLTAYGSIATALEAVRLGAKHYLTKPADVDDILAAFGDKAKPRASGNPTPVPSLARVEWEHINRVLVECGGNITHAARLLGIHRRSLQRKLAKFPLSH